MLPNMGIPVSSKAQHLITRSGCNFQQLLFTLNEASLDEQICLGAPSKPGIDIKGMNKPSHQGQVSLGAFQRQKADEFTTQCTVPNFRPSVSNEASASNPFATDYTAAFMAGQRAPQDHRERAQDLVRRYTEGEIKGDAFQHGLRALGVDVGAGSEIARLQAKMEGGDERVGFRAFNKAIAMQFA